MQAHVNTVSTETQTGGAVLPIPLNPSEKYEALATLGALAEEIITRLLHINILQNNVIANLDKANSADPDRFLELLNTMECFSVCTSRNSALANEHAIELLNLIADLRREGAKR